jgi:hypothetical protein
MKTIITILAAVSFSACTSIQEGEVVRQPKEDGSVETVISIKHLKGYDLLVTNYKIWVNGQLDRTILTTDTLKSLGNVTKTFENDFGQAERRSIPKNYEIYITVK